MLRDVIGNAGTIAVSLVLIGLVALIIVRLRRDRKQGKTACGCQCGSCPMAGTCHKPS